MSLLPISVDSRSRCDYNCDDNFSVFAEDCTSMYERFGARVSVRNTTLQFDNLITKCAMQDTSLRDVVYDVLRDYVPDSRRFSVYLKGGSAIAEMTNESEFYRGDIDIGVKHEDPKEFERMMFAQNFGRRGGCGGGRCLGDREDEEPSLETELNGETDEKLLCGFDVKAMKIAFRRGIQRCENRIIRSLITEWGRVRDFLLTGTLNEPGSLARADTADAASAAAAASENDAVSCYLFDTYNSVLNEIRLSRRRSKLTLDDFKGNRIFCSFASTNSHVPLPCFFPDFLSLSPPPTSHLSRRSFLIFSAATFNLVLFFLFVSFPGISRFSLQSS